MKFECVVEIPKNEGKVKYEMQRDINGNNILHVDRILNVAMYYPGNYGFILNTLGGDGDSLDVIILCDDPIAHGAVVLSRPIGVLEMEDEKGMDEKIIAVPDYKIDTSLSHINDVSDLHEMKRKKIEHFFERYKDLEENKWVKIIKWGNVQRAVDIINLSYDRYKVSNCVEK